jgi:hypothetical protein
MQKSSFRLSWFGSFVGVVLIVLSMLNWMGCERSLDSPSEPQEQDVLSLVNPKVQEVAAVQDNYTLGLMANPEVVGTATGLTEDGRLAILVFAKSEKIQISDKVELAALKKGVVKDAVPTSIEGLPVVVEVTGIIHAMKSGGVSHKAKQTPPIQLGTSGGWRYDLANGYCCGGTLGSLIQKSGTQYILSNYHVLYADIVNGGNSRTAQPGDPVIQPGLIDVNCNANNAQNVATLVTNGGSLPSANVDAGIAQVISGMVRTDGAILEIGTISSQTIAASIRQAVKKSGRTTGLTRSSITGLNATVSVAYDNECAGGDAFTKTFTGQIVIRNRGSSFLNSGDSGSLMVQDVTTNPKAVGLLYAGSSSTAIANPINAVLSWAGGATMVGQ